MWKSVSFRRLTLESKEGFMQPKKVLDKLNGNYNCEYWDVRIEETFKTDIVFEDFELILVMKNHLLVPC